jgi:serine/threonine protein kinase
MINSMLNQSFFVFLFKNLLLISDTDHATIKVADFGFARRVHTPESLTSRVGTPTYVAPEVRCCVCQVGI